MLNDTDFAILVPCARQPSEIKRLSHLLESIALCEPHVSCVVLVEDGMHETPLIDHLPYIPGFKYVCLSNPRDLSGPGLLGGLFVGVMHGLHWLFANTTVNFVLKLDTDSLVLRPFCNRIAKQLADKQIGQIGTVGRTSNRLDPTYGFESAFRSPLLALLDEDFNLGLRSQTMSGSANLSHFGLQSPYLLERLRPLIQRAHANGYRSLDYCQGGGYVISRAMLERLDKEGCFNNYADWSMMPVGEDVIMGMYTHSLDLRLADYSDHGEVFGLHWRGLPFSPLELLRLGFSIIHSVKMNDSDEEDRLYRFFVQNIRATIRNELQGNHFDLK